MTEEITNINRYREIADTHPVASVREEAERLVNRATPGQKYAVHEAASILAYWRGVNNNPSEVYVPGLPEQQVQNVSGIRSIRLTQSTLADYLEKAFVAGQRAEFDRLDKEIRNLYPCAACSDGMDLHCSLCGGTGKATLSQNSEYRRQFPDCAEREESTDWQPPAAQESDTL